MTHLSMVVCVTSITPRIVCEEVDDSVHGSARVMLCCSFCHPSCIRHTKNVGTKMSCANTEPPPGKFRACSRIAQYCVACAP